jgi:hypothetical protein
MNSEGKDGKELKHLQQNLGRYVCNGKKKVSCDKLKFHIYSLMQKILTIKLYIHVHIGTPMLD